MSSNRGGGALLFSKSFLPASYQVEEVIAGRLIILRAEFENLSWFYKCLCPYKWDRKSYFLNSVNTVLQNCKTDEYVLLGGDFNCTEMNWWTEIMWSLMRIQVEYLKNN